MKLILTEDVYKKGVAGEVVEVTNGFARNYLIPQGMAVQATPGALKRWAALSEKAAARRAERDKNLSALGESIEALTLAFSVKAGETGKLYGSVTTAQVGEAMNAELGTDIDHRRIGDQSLRQLGQHKVGVRLSSGLTPQITVLVHREGEPPESVMGIEPEAVGQQEDLFDFELEDLEDDEEAGDSETAEDEADVEAILDLLESDESGIETEAETDAETQPQMNTEAEAGEETGDSEAE